MNQHEPCNQIVSLSKSVEIYLWIISTIAGFLMVWATYITVEIFAGKTADAVQVTKYDVILEKLESIEHKLDKKLGD